MTLIHILLLIIVKRHILSNMFIGFFAVEYETSTWILLRLLAGKHVVVLPLLMIVLSILTVNSGSVNIVYKGLFYLVLLFWYRSTCNAGVLSSGLLNVLFFIHPIILGIGIFCLYRTLSLVTAIRWLNLGIVAPTLTYIFLLTLSLVLGAWWASQELNWGGWWSWDLIELSAVNMIIIFTSYYHNLISHVAMNVTPPGVRIRTNNVVSPKNICCNLHPPRFSLVFTQLEVTSFLTSIIFILTFNRYFVPNSVHSFTDNSNHWFEEKTVYWLYVLFIVLSFYVYGFKSCRQPHPLGICLQSRLSYFRKEVKIVYKASYLGQKYGLINMVPFFLWAIVAIGVMVGGIYIKWIYIILIYFTVILIYNASAFLKNNLFRPFNRISFVIRITHVLVLLILFTYSFTVRGAGVGSLSNTSFLYLTTHLNFLSLPLASFWCKPYL